MGETRGVYNVPATILANAIWISQVQTDRPLVGRTGLAVLRVRQDGLANLGCHLGRLQVGPCSHGPGSASPVLLQTPYYSRSSLRPRVSPVLSRARHEDVCVEKSVPPCVFGARHGDHIQAPHTLRRLIHGERSVSTRRSSRGLPDMAEAV